MSQNDSGSVRKAGQPAGRLRLTESDMGDPSLIIGAATGTPAVHVHVNPLYALYHYLIREGQRPREERDSVVAEAARGASQARRLTGVHGVWDVWEQRVARAGTADEAVAGLMEAMTGTIAELGSALRAAESEFRQRLWPERQVTIQAALTTIQDLLQPSFVSMARRQATVLDLVWPQRIDVYLVTDCYDWQGGYSHPLTIDVTTHGGVTLCETLLHETTHVADVYTGEVGKESFRTRLMATLIEDGIPPPHAWNAWHAVIFAASGHHIRAFIEPAHMDYAEAYNLYRWLKVPDLPELWGEWMAGMMDERDFLRVVADRVRSNLD